MRMLKGHVLIFSVLHISVLPCPTMSIVERYPGNIQQNIAGLLSAELSLERMIGATSLGLLPLGVFSLGVFALGGVLFGGILILT